MAQESLVGGIQGVERGLEGGTRRLGNQRVAAGTRITS